MLRLNCNPSAILLLLAAAFQVSALPSANAQTVPIAKQNAKTSNHTQFGDVTISEWKGFKGNILNLANGHFIGPNIIVETTDKTRRIRMRILANDIAGSYKKDKASVEISGNLRYTITETTKTGDRVLNGTASRAVYDQEPQRLRLLGGVRATLADPTQFDKPATVHAGNATIYTGGKSMRYTLAGAPNANDVVVSQRGKPRTVKGVVEPPHTTTLHVYNYDSAEFTVGQSASFNGAGTTADAADLEAKTTGSLRAPHIEASFAGSSAGSSQEGKLQKASASGGVHYTAQSPGVRGSTQKLAGTSLTASYDLAQNRVVLDGGVEADITDTDALKSPAHISVGKLSVLMKKSPQYSISGSAQRTKIVFTPKPGKKKPITDLQGVNTPTVNPNPGAGANAAGDQDKKVIAPPFGLGTITISGFSSGIYEPGKTATLEGSATTFASSDKTTRSTTELKAEKIVGAFSEQGELETTTATKNVHYALSQPSPSGKVLQAITGTGISVVFSNSEKSQQVIVTGPYRADVTDPETLEGPLHINASDASDSFTFNLTTKDFHPQSPNGTTVIDFKSRESAIIPKAGVKGTLPGKNSNTRAKNPNKKSTAPGK